MSESIKSLFRSRMIARAGSDKGSVTLKVPGTDIKVKIGGVPSVGASRETLAKLAQLAGATTTDKDDVESFKESTVSQKHTGANAAGIVLDTFAIVCDGATDFSDEKPTNRVASVPVKNGKPVTA